MMTPQLLVCRPVTKRVWLKFAGLLAVLTGVIGMHGLANHGVGGMDAMGAMDSMAPSVMMDMADAADASGVTDESTVDPPGASSTVDLAEQPHVAGSLVTSLRTVAADSSVSRSTSPVGGGARDGAMSGLCVAILALGLGALTMLLNARRMPLTWSPVQARARGVALPGRPPESPSLAALSLRRC